MPNSMFPSLPGPSRAAYPSTSTTQPPPAAEVHSPAADVQEFPKLKFPIARMITRKNFPLLMCSENDIYDPQLIEAIQSYNYDLEENFVVSPHITLNATYASYHRKTVSWMVCVERRGSINNQSQSTGAILADVLDEDKRLEMLSCIVANPSPQIVHRQKVLLDGRSEELKSDYPIPLHCNCIISKMSGILFNIPKAFNISIQDTSQSIIHRLSYKLSLSKRNVENENILACYCNNMASNDFLIICGMCGEAQHESCVVYNPKIQGGLPYLCSSCWTFNDLILCRATLIIVPDYCLELWIQDIQNIISMPLKYFVYNGIQSCKFMQPTIFNDFDVVLMTYSKLVKELNYGQRYVDENQTATGLRCFKKYPQSPLLCLKWWRICLDQPQAYNSDIEKVFEFLLPLKSGHKWIMPGMLVQESSKNFFSILKHLDLLGAEFAYDNFIKVLKEKQEDYIALFSNILWCNLIKNINIELNSPVPIYELHWLKFSKIEKYFYQESSKLFTVKTSRLINKKKSVLKKKLMDVDRDTKQNIVGDILTLLEACVAPLIRGEYKLKINGTFNLISTSEDKVIKHRAELIELLHQCVTNLKKLAEVYTFLPNDAGYAFHQYIIILMDIINDYHKKELSIGTDYQIIELVHKFLTLLKEKNSPEINHPVYSISYLENTIQDLESNILNFHSNNILHERQMLQQKLSETNNIAEKINSLGSNDWWIHMLECILSPSDFLSEVKTIIDSNRKARVPNITNRLKSMNDVNFTLTNWLSNIVITRNNVLSMYKTLDEDSDGNNIKFGCNKAICIIRNECLFCQFVDQLSHYKKLIINYNIEDLDENIIKNLTESNREQIVSQHEILLRSLILCETNDSVTDDYIKIAIEQMEILNVLSLEFIYVWKLWLSLDKYKKACEQLIKAKSMSTINDILAEIKTPGRSTKKKKMNDNVEVTNLLQHHLSILRSENSQYLDKLKCKYESLRILRVVKFISGMSHIFNSCIVCMTCANELVVLYCCHLLCSNCLIQACNNSNSIDLSCPYCGISNSMENMECFKQNRKTRVEIMGSYSTKIQSIVCKLKEVIALDECSKVIIFSSFQTSLDCLSSALTLNSVDFMKLDLGCFNISTVLNNFQNSENVTTILINLNIRLNNLKLNFATRVFFMEPIMDKSFEYQIVDQICCKQIKQIYVHHFIVKNSIEEKIRKTFTYDDPSLGIDLTLGQLSKLLINKKYLQTN